jgi:hypothetical protein
MRKSLFSSFIFCVLLSALLFLVLPANVFAEEPLMSVTSDSLYEYTLISGVGVTIDKYLGTEEYVQIPSTIEDEPVIAIGPYAFSDNDYITRVKVPESVTEIGNCAFISCENLNSVIIYYKTVAFGVDVFTGSGNVVVIAFPGSTAWSYATSYGIEKVDIDDYNHTQYEYNDITGGVIITKYLGTDQEIVVPDTLDGKTVLEIGEEAFYANTSLTEISFPESVVSIGDSAFLACSNLIKLDLPNTMTKIGDHAFRNCVRLTNLTFPNYVASIGSFAFADCRSLNNVTIPVSITSIPYYAFSGCTKLTSITIPDTVISIEASAFSGCTKLIDVIMPDTVTSIGQYAFYDCRSIADITLSETLADLGNYAFANCTSITDIIIPELVDNLDASVFSGCSALASIQFNSASTDLDGKIPVEVIIIADDPSSAKDYAETNGNPFQLIGEDESTGNFSKKGMIAYLVKDADGNYFEYNNELLNLSYLVYQLNPTNDKADMYRHYRAIINDGGYVIAVKDGQKGYMNYTAMRTAYLKAVLAGNPFVINDYLALNTAIKLSATVTNVQVVDADGNIFGLPDYDIEFGNTLSLGMKYVSVTLDVDNPLNYSVSYNGIKLIYEEALDAFVGEIPEETLETLSPVIERN